MPRMSKLGHVRDLMQRTGQPQSVEAIQQHVEMAGGGNVTWPELQGMIESGELVAVDQGPNGKGGRLTHYGPGPQLQGQDDDADQAGAAPEMTPETAPPTVPNAQGDRAAAVPNAGGSAGRSGPPPAGSAA